MLFNQFDLGFRGVALVVLLLLFLGPVLVLLVRQRWRLAKARKEEVERLFMLAAEEAARAEMEAALLAFVPSDSAVSGGGGGGAAGGSSLCAVCFSPTTTRCSRCKAIKYCSGKCQIVHWRQGHKDECQPQPVDDHSDGQKSVSNLEGVGAEQSNVSVTSLEIEGKAYAKVVETFLKQSTSSELNSCSDVFSEDDNPEDRPVINTSGTENTSDSSSCSTFSGPVETSDDSSVSDDFSKTIPELFSSTSPDSLGESLSYESFPDISGTAANNEDADFMKFSSSDVSTANSSADNASCSINSEHKVSTCKTEGVQCSLSGPSGVNFSGPASCTNMELSENNGHCQDFDSSAGQTSESDNSTDSQICKEGDCIQLDAGPKQMLAKLSSQVETSLRRSRNENSLCGTAASEGVQFGTRDLNALGIGKSVCNASVSTDAWLSESKAFKSLSSAGPLGDLSSSVGSQSVSRDTSSKANVVPRDSTTLFESTGSIPNCTSDLKTSLRRRVFQQIKTSRHYPSAVTSYISGKSNKMLFPYDLFIKLYNSDKVELRPCGLINCGNSCYANAVLQCLAFTGPLTAYLLEGLHTKTCPKKEWCFTCEFENLLMKTKQGKSPLSPIRIISHIQNIGVNLCHGKEEDAHEFLRYAIDAMHSACLKEAGANAVGRFAEETTLVHLIFGGYLRSKIQCMRCHGKSERHEHMMDLTVEIHGDIGTLEEALARFTATEILDGENKYQCNRCKSYERAKKKLMISEAPNVLTIALKRYQSGKFGKLNKIVRFPECLDLAPYMHGTGDKSPVYRLYGVVVHLDIMNAAFSGHYICYVKTTQGKWYKIDDTVVTPVEIDRVLNKGAYMLLYARCSPRAPSLLRKSMSQDHGNSRKNKCKEDLKARSNQVLFGVGSSVEHDRAQANIHHRTEGPVSFESYDLFAERFLRPRSDSSSDSSSLLSCSDEGSWSTDSTRDSTSTEEYSEYLFGETGQASWKSPMRFFEDSDGLAYSPLNSNHSSGSLLNGQVPDLSGFNTSVHRDSYSQNGSRYDGTGEGFLRGKRSHFLYSDRSEECRKLTSEQCNSGETDWVNPSEGKSSVVRRSSTRESTAQTFY